MQRSHNSSSSGLLAMPLAGISSSSDDSDLNSDEEGVVSHAQSSSSDSSDVDALTISIDDESDANDLHLQAAKRPRKNMHVSKDATKRKNVKKMGTMKTSSGNRKGNNGRTSALSETHEKNVVGKLEPQSKGQIPSMNFASPRTGNKQLYCICRSEDDGTRFMVGCDGCEEWFHGSCVGVTQDMALASRVYYCERCRRSNPSDQKSGAHKARTPPPRSLTGGLAVMSDSSSGFSSSSSSSDDTSSSSDEANRARIAKGMKRNIMKVISEVSNGSVNIKNISRKRSRVDAQNAKAPSKRTKFGDLKGSAGWEVDEEACPAVRRYGMGKGGGKGGKVFNHPKANSLSGDEDELDLLDLCPVCDGKCTCNSASNQNSAPTTPIFYALKGRRGSSGVANFDEDDDEIFTEKKRPKPKTKGWTVEPTRTKTKGNSVEQQGSVSMDLFDHEPRKQLTKKSNTAALVTSRGLDTKKKSAPVPLKAEKASAKTNVEKLEQRKSKPQRKKSRSSRNANRGGNLPVQRKEELELEDGMEYLIDIEGDEDEEVVAVDSIAAVAAARAAKRTDVREDRRSGGSKRRSKRKNSGDEQVILMFEPPHGMVVVGGESNSDSDEELSDLVIDSDSEEEAVRIGQKAGLLVVDDDTGNELDEDDFHETATTTGVEDSEQSDDSDDDSEDVPDEDEIVESFIAGQVYGLSWSDEEDEDEDLDHIISAEGEEGEQGSKNSSEANSELPSPTQIEATGQQQQTNSVVEFDDVMEEDVGVVVNRKEVEAIASAAASNVSNQNSRLQSLAQPATNVSGGGKAGTVFKAEDPQPGTQQQQQSFSFDVKKTQLGPNGEIITTTKNLTFSLQPKSGAKPPPKRSKKDAPDANKPRDKFPESNGLGKFVIPMPTTKPLLATPSTSATVPQPAAPSLPPPPPPAVTPPFGPNFFSALLPGLINAAHSSPLIAQNWGQAGAAAGKAKALLQPNGTAAKGTNAKKSVEENPLNAMGNLFNTFLNPFAAGLTALAGNPQVSGSGTGASSGKKEISKNGQGNASKCASAPVPALPNAQNPDAYQAYMMAATIAHMHNVQQVLFAAAMAQQQQQAAGSKSGKDKGTCASDDKSNSSAIQPFLEIQKQLEEMAKTGGAIPPFIPPFPFPPGDQSKASANDLGMAAFAAAIGALGAGMFGIPAPGEAPDTDVSTTKSSSQTYQNSNAPAASSQDGSKRTKFESNSGRGYPGSTREFPYVYLRKRKMQEEPEPNISIDEFVDTEALEEDREDDVEENVSEEEKESSPKPTGSMSADRKPSRTPNRAGSVAAETPSPAFSRWQRIPIGTFRRSRRPSGGWNRELAAAIRAAIAENGQPENMHATLLDRPLSLITKGQSAEANSDSPGIFVKEESSGSNRRNSVLPNGGRKEKRQRLALLDDDTDEVDYPNGLQSPLLVPVRSSPSLRPVGFGFVPRANQSSGQLNPGLRRSSLSISSLNSGANTPSSTVFTFPEKFASSSEWMPVVLLGDPAQKFDSDGFVELNLDAGVEKGTVDSTSDMNCDNDMLHLDPETQEIQIEVQVEEIGSGKSTSISTSLNDGIEMADSSGSGTSAGSTTAAILEHVAMVAAAAAVQVASAAANMVTSQDINLEKSDTGDPLAEPRDGDGLSSDVKLEIARILSGEMPALDVGQGVSSSRTTFV